MQLEGKIAIITGGGDGIGRGIALCLAEEGADVVVIDMNVTNAEKVASEIMNLGRKSLAIKANARIGSEVMQSVEDAIKKFGKIDILVNNVGGHAEAGEARKGTSIVDQTEAEWDEAYELNLKSQVMFSKAVAPYMKKQRSGKIINISSIVGKMGSTMNMYYASMKAGVILLTRSLAQELGKDNINVNCICPGFIYTKAWENLERKLMEVSEQPFKRKEFFLTTMVNTVPLGREQTPEDIGWAVVFFASESASNITGQSLNVDGGVIMD